MPLKIKPRKILFLGAIFPLRVSLFKVPTCPIALLLTCSSEPAKRLLVTPGKVLGRSASLRACRTKVLRAGLGRGGGRVRVCGAWGKATDSTV